MHFEFADHKIKGGVTVLATQYDMRDYQQAAKDAVLNDWKQGIRSTMVVLPTGTGKTVVSSSVAETLWEWHHTREIDYSGAILFLAPREELILQTRDKFVRQIPDARIAIEMGDEHKAHRQLFRKPEIVLATTASMLSRYKHYPKDYFGAAFLDECFVAGTKVDGRNIETIAEGELVRSFNHDTGQIELRPVLRVSKRRPVAGLLRVTIEDGRSFICTPEHPFFASCQMSCKKYVKAKDLTPSDYVFGECRAGLREGSVPDWDWLLVERVEVVENSGDEFFGGLCSDGYVYNFEVDGNHNYFVDGVLVHNCHHSTGKSYTEPLEYFSDSIQYILGMTATPKRHDGKAMGRVFDHCSYSMLLPQAVDLGWICEPRVERIPVRELRLQNVNNVAGDFAQGALSKELCREPVLRAMVAATISLSTGRQTAIYCVDIAHMQAVERELARNGQRSVLIDGKTPKLIRRSRLKSFADYDVQFIVSCGTLTTGWDCPACEVIAMFRPTQSLTLYEQIVGRALRPLNPPNQETPEARRQGIAQSAKPFALILDFVGNSRHKLANIGDILGGSFDEEVRRLAMDLAKQMSGPIDMSALLKQAEAALEARRAAQYDRSSIEGKLKEAIWRLNPHPFDVLGLNRDRVEESVEKNDAYGASLEKSRKTLEDYQLRQHEWQRLTNKEVVYLARVLVARTNRRYASFAQSRLLWRLGYTANVTLAAASGILDRCSSRGWIRPHEEGWNPRYDEVRARDEFAYMWKAIDQFREQFNGQRRLLAEE